MRAIEIALAPHGLNLVGATATDTYDARVPSVHALAALAPGARTALVVGNGGGAFWDAFRAHRAAQPRRFAGPDPLDAFTRHAVESVLRPLLAGIPARFLYPFRFPAEPVSFVHLAECAGLGRRSLLGILLHPHYGPWIALRAAVLLPVALVAPRPADGFDPCPSCVARPCIAACPAGAVDARGWDVPRCAASRRRHDDPCATRCHARVACVVGPEHRYPDDALVHHQTHARCSLAAAGRG